MADEKKIADQEEANRMALIEERNRKLRYQLLLQLSRERRQRIRDMFANPDNNAKFAF